MEAQCVDYVTTNLSLHESPRKQKVPSDLLGFTEDILLN